MGLRFGGLLFILLVGIGIAINPPSPCPGIGIAINPPSPCPNNFNIDNVIAHLNELDIIATGNDGNRAAGTSGYQTSVGYVQEVLQKNTDYTIRIQDFPFTTFLIIGTPQFSQSSPFSKQYTYKKDFIPMSDSGSGSVTATVSLVKNQGCVSSDFSNFPSGSIAIIERGVCTFSEKASLAKIAGAVGVIIFNNNYGGLFNGACLSDLPVYAVSSALGSSFIGENVQLIMNVVAHKETSITSNIIAETKSGNANSVILIGSHLDSVTAGPGINDNGSGSATNLEIALTLYKCIRPVNKIRFVWWGAEELGLLGSEYYVNDLVTNNPQELENIALNINIDMLGSPNFFFGIYNGSGAAPSIRDESVIIQKRFENFITSKGRQYELTPFDGRSDYGPFIENGVPAGGLFSGAEAIKDGTRRTKYGGLANTAYDPCYHDYCDSYENIARESLEILSTAAFEVTKEFAMDLQLKQTFKHQLLKQKYHYPKHPLALSRY